MRVQHPDGIKLDLPDSDIIYYQRFLAATEANQYFKIFKNSISWQQDTIKVYGKIYPQPRLTALYGNNDRAYSYSGITMYPKNFTAELLEIKEKIESQLDVVFTTCLLNLYRDGQDSNGWHADDEKELGIHPVIASLSLGQERYFHLKHKQFKERKHKMVLQHGSLLIMKGATQHHWLHQIPKTSRSVAGRINLTFRIIE